METTTNPQETTTAPIIPSETNCPKGTLYCPVCKSHQPAKKMDKTSIAGQGMCKDAKACKERKDALPKVSLKDKAKAAADKAKTSTTKAPKAAKLSAPKAPSARDKVKEFINGKTEFTVQQIADLLATNYNNASTTVSLLITRPGTAEPIPFHMDKAKGKGVYVANA